MHKRFDVAIGIPTDFGENVGFELGKVGEFALAVAVIENVFYAVTGEKRVIFAHRAVAEERIQVVRVVSRIIPDHHSAARKLLPSREIVLEPSVPLAVFVGERVVETVIDRRVEDIHVVVRHYARVERNELAVDFFDGRLDREIVRERDDKDFAVREFGFDRRFYLARDRVYKAHERARNAVFFVSRLAFFAAARVDGVVLRDGEKLRLRVFAHAVYDFGGDFVDEVGLRKAQLPARFVEPFGVSLFVFFRRDQVVKIMSLPNGAVASVRPERRKIAARNLAAIAVLDAHFRDVIGVAAGTRGEYLPHFESGSFGVVEGYFAVGASFKIRDKLLVERVKAAAEFFEHVVHGVHRARARINRIFAGKNDGRRGRTNDERVVCELCDPFAVTRDGKDGFADEKTVRARGRFATEFAPHAENFAYVSDKLARREKTIVVRVFGNGHICVLWYVHSGFSLAVFVGVIVCCDG